MARGKTYEGDEDVKLSITPLIDVTFLRVRNQMRQLTLVQEAFRSIRRNKPRSTRPGPTS